MSVIGDGSFIVETLKEKGGVIQIPYSSMIIESRINAEYTEYSVNRERGGLKTFLFIIKLLIS